MGAPLVSNRAACLAVAMAAFSVVPADASPVAEPAARFMSLRTDEANGRRGPAPDQPILWVYKSRGLPMQVLAASGEYLQLRDPDGDKVWIHRSQVSTKRTVFVKPADKPLAVRRDPDLQSRPVAVLEPRVLASLDGCDGAWRKISAGGHSGWAPAGALFGAQSCEGVAP
jgi:SH3-like domain-containing protein